MLLLLLRRRRLRTDDGDRERDQALDGERERLLDTERALDLLFSLSGEDASLSTSAITAITSFNAIYHC